MNKKFIPVAVFVLSSIAVIQWITVLGYENALFERFPHIDPKVVAKAHRKMYRRTLAGHYNNIELTDDNCDEIFLTIVQELAK